MVSLFFTNSNNVRACKELSTLCSVVWCVHFSAKVYFEAICTPHAAAGRWDVHIYVVKYPLLFRKGEKTLKFHSPHICCATLKWNHNCERSDPLAEDY